MNRAERRAAAKLQRGCYPHRWISKPDYPGLGTWCELCGKRKGQS